jgi:hypothetical protein
MKDWEGWYGFSKNAGDISVNCFAKVEIVLNTSFGARIRSADISCPPPLWRQLWKGQRWKMMP